MSSPLVLPNDGHYWLENAHIPPNLVQTKLPSPQKFQGTTPWEDLALYHLEIADGRIKSIVAVEAGKNLDEGIDRQNIPRVNLNRRMILPCFVDMHTHLDKGHIWGRSPNIDGTFAEAIAITERDAELHHSSEDIYRRMEFALQCSYAHGTAAVRTHIEMGGQQSQIAWKSFQQLRQAWANRLILQGVAMVTTDYYLGSAGEKLADQMAHEGGILGGVAYAGPQVKTQLTRLMSLAQARNLDIDLHVDENGDRHSQVLHQAAATALEIGFTGQIVCGHCCSLDVQTPQQVEDTLELVKQANIAIVSLPLCNLYLQGRHQPQKPAWRGITKVHAIQSQGIPLVFASDNCRDPFFPFGDHDGLEVLNQSVRIGQLDPPYGQWCTTVNLTPARLMGLANNGILRVDAPADLVIFSARYFNELFSRSQGDRLVIRRGKPTHKKPPHYQELDDLMGA
ncbi:MULTISPECIES: cytosine deaminase [unclassified Synechocystis]|uniref:cytosine deaminase n=1 Tax=unclassified Synechocystis TaxID=2640012 RepID=UPI00040E9655|nr:MULTISPECIES: cytosine deaminase [unclassified Synechocystis]AIE75983.1 Cytosine deaminase [Synechocystis sp. PCC 6714]MCT0255104.1 cytosine deaminase [Synechocystis sp. CS-94]